MESLVFGMGTLRKGSSSNPAIPVDEALLAATTEEEIMGVLKDDKESTVRMCSECRTIQGRMGNANVED